MYILSKYKSIVYIFLPQKNTQAKSVKEVALKIKQERTGKPQI